MTLHALCFPCHRLQHPMDLSSSASLFSSGSRWVSFLVGCKVNQLDNEEFMTSLALWRPSTPEKTFSICHFFYDGMLPATVESGTMNIISLKGWFGAAEVGRNIRFDKKKKKVIPFETRNIFPASLFKMSCICFKIWVVRQFLMTSQIFQQFLSQVLKGAYKASCSTLRLG